MKRFLYSLCLIVSLAGVNSCKKDDPEPISPVVGKWGSDIVRRSGLTGVYSSANGDLDALTVYGIRTNFEVKTDKTFAGSDRSSGAVEPFDGTWDYAGNSLTLKFTDGNEETLDYDETKKELLSEVVATQDTVENPTTKAVEVVRYNLQLIYSKQ